MKLVIASLLIASAAAFAPAASFGRGSALKMSEVVTEAKVRMTKTPGNEDKLNRPAMNTHSASANSVRFPGCAPTYSYIIWLIQ